MVDNIDPFTGIVPFLRVAETLSFRRSAESLGVTPAAVSRTIQRLEERVGARLLERTTRSVRLTSEGAQFALRCREAHAQMRIAEGELSVARGVPQGTLSVSSSQILAPLVTPALSRFLVRHPAVRADLRLSDRVVRFAEEDVDVALRVGAVDDPDVVAHALLRPRWVLVASPAYLARRGAPRVPEDLTTHACVRFIPPRARRRPWTLDGRAIAVTGPLDVDRGDVLVTAALSDAGIARVLDFMVSAELRDGRLVEVLPGVDGGGTIVSAVHSASRRSVPRIRAFLALLRDELSRVR
ncbi:MAG: LysR family transcriptional regulator [Labilithrix sp.]|nr:LysR family transcriptional regulator [Labilithrix sp.]